MSGWRIDPRERTDRWGRRRKFHFVTDGHRGRHYDTKSSARAVLDALEGRCQPGGWATQQAFEVRGLKEGAEK